MPQFAPTAQFGVQPPNILGAQQLFQANQLAAFNAANQRQSGLQSGLFGLGSAALVAGLMPGGFLGVPAAAAPTVFASHSTFKTDKRLAPVVLPMVDELNIETLLEFVTTA